MKRIVSKHFVVKRTIEGTNTSVDFIPNVKSKTAPEIAESYTNDDCEVMHILTNGNEISDLNYMLHWGKPKTKPNFSAKTEKVNPNPFTLK